MGWVGGLIGTNVSNAVHGVRRLFDSHSFCIINLISWLFVSINDNAVLRKGDKKVLFLGLDVVEEGLFLKTP